MDQHNPITKLCVEGLRAESQGKNAEASRYFMQAWKKRTNDLESCVAAHYVARQQKTVEDSLVWNLKALSFADKIDAEQVKTYYPSLYINIADGYEKTGKKKEAKKYYDLAASVTTAENAGSFGIYLLQSIKEGQKRTG